MLLQTESGPRRWSSSVGHRRGKLRQSNPFGGVRPRPPPPPAQSAQREKVGAGGGRPGPRPSFAGTKGGRETGLCQSAELPPPLSRDRTKPNQTGLLRKARRERPGPQLRLPLREPSRESRVGTGRPSSHPRGGRLSKRGRRPTPSSSGAGRRDELPPGGAEVAGEESLKNGRDFCSASPPR